MDVVYTAVLLAFFALVLVAIAEIRRREKISRSKPREDSATDSFGGDGTYYVDNWYHVPTDHGHGDGLHHSSGFGGADSTGYDGFHGDAGGWHGDAGGFGHGDGGGHGGDGGGHH